VAYPKTDTMSSEILTIRQTIRCYEGTNNPQLRDRWAAKIRIIGRTCPEAAPWAAAFEICVAYNEAQTRACAEWRELGCNAEERMAMRYAILGAANCRTFDELAAMTPAERFADGHIPRWLRHSWDGEGEASDARTRLDDTLA